MSTENIRVLCPLFLPCPSLLDRVHLFVYIFPAAINYGNMDNDFTVARMISCGIPLDESYLQYRLSILMKEEKKSLRNGKLHVPDCFYLMGTADPTGKLKSDEVCIVLYVLFLAIMSFLLRQHVPRNS